MSFLYIWQSSGISPTEAQQRFSSVLEQQNALFAQTFGRPFRLRIHSLQNIHIGQISTESGIQDWCPWTEADANGIAWGGVCENFLGHLWNNDTVQELHSCIHERPEDMGSWDGRWVVSAWNKESVTVATSATDCPSFWWTKGPNGWACGSHGIPILKLVGSKPEIDRVAASLYLCYGYLLGSKSLLGGVERLSARQTVKVEQSNSPRISSFFSLGDYYAGSNQLSGTRKRLQICSERLEERVGRQLHFSPTPELLLSGGRDSRCIGATLVKVGYTATAVTSGPPVSTDVKIAKKVSSRLGLRHRLIAQEESPLQAVLEDVGTVRSWVRLNEATTTVRFAVPYQGLFKGIRPYPPQMAQIFHGLHGLAHGLGSEVNSSLMLRLSHKSGVNQSSQSDMQFIRSLLQRTWNPGFIYQKQISEVVEQVHRQFDEEAKSVDANVAQWLALLYWESRCLHWGEDLMAIKDVLGWNWTPLLDRVLNQAFWQANAEGDVERDFIAELNTVAAVRLGQMDYDRNSPGTPLTFSRLIRGVQNRTRQVIGRIVPGYANRFLPIPIDDALQAFWEATLLSEKTRVWPELIRREAIEELIEHDPLSEILWGAAGLELFAEEIENNF